MEPAVGTNRNAGLTPFDSDGYALRYHGNNIHMFLSVIFLAFDYGFSGSNRSSEPWSVAIS